MNKLTPQMWGLIWQNTLQTFHMVSLSTVFSVLLGLPLGILLCITSPESQGGLKPKPVINEILSRIVNILRSFPFIILI
ncbi:MAG: methionine ABC transporter permease, partial [Spirochaetales bacterium]